MREETQKHLGLCLSEMKAGLEQYGAAVSEFVSETLQRDSIQALPEQERSDELAEVVGATVQLGFDYMMVIATQLGLGLPDVLLLVGVAHERHQEQELREAVTQEVNDSEQETNAHTGGGE
ncbi:unnamed protein product [marine sediment metagenome]|uniref:Uncharacterized protein n=1 Tax=marine sediment metagenome TaxID=412755 RepID=X0XWJ1_9ZZZZ